MRRYEPRPTSFAALLPRGRRSINCFQRHSRWCARRANGPHMRHFDVQLVGGMALHQRQDRGNAHRRGQDPGGPCPAISMALAGAGVHVVTVNDYLANRDATWMGRLYNFLGLSGASTPIPRAAAPRSARKQTQAYGSTSPTGRTNEFGFDYLRDNMVYQIAERVQRPLSYRHCQRWTRF